MKMAGATGLTGGYRCTATRHEYRAIQPTVEWSTAGGGIVPVQHLKASALVVKRWSAFCVECGDKAAGASGDGLWTIWTSEMIYCPACAKREGIGPDDY